MMRMAPAVLLVAVIVCGACGGSTPSPQGPPAPAYDPEYPTAAAPEKPVVATPAAPAPAPPATGAAPAGPGRERAAQLREAADLLDKAEAARERDAKSFAEQLFSSAELITGAEALAELAPRFREGAPPRVTTPTKPVSKDTAPQPVAEGDSEKDHPEPPKPKRGTVNGEVKLDGKLFSGDFAVVTLEPLGKKKIAFPTARVIEQRNRQFAPRVLVVPTGSLVSFPNFDPTFHNVFSSSSTKPFDLGLYKSGETREILFDKEGTIRLACNLHANMSAFIVVSSAPHYRITDGSGKFSFKSLEPGKYLVKAYSERSMEPVSQEIDIKAGSNNLALGVKGDAPMGPLPDKFGVARGSKP